MFQKSEKIHFIGIGGIGMSALAGHLMNKGSIVSGSDLCDSQILQNLKKHGAKIFLDQKGSNISDDIDLVIITLAIEENNPELISAKSKKIKILTYPQALGEFTAKFNLISICGSHGKSTSTAMLSEVLISANLDPNVLIGTKLKEFGNTNYRIGKSDYFVMESCEYKEAFLNYSPSAILVTNIDPDHLDYYGNAENYYKAYEKFVGRLKDGGILVVNGDENKIPVFTGMTKKTGVTETFGENEKNDYVLKGNEIYLHGELIGKLNLKVPGRHNRMNACGVFVIADVLKIDRKVILNALNNFAGTWRRLEYKGKIESGAILYDDYGHHPTEIKASLEAMRELYPLNNLICVFQPHQFSRTRFFWDEFARSFNHADQVIIPNIYKVRDEKSDFPEISAETLVKEISKHHENVVYGNGFENTVKMLKEKTNGNDIIIIMGAGDVEKLSLYFF